jgi:hypothetical protein
MTLKRGTSKRMTINRERYNRLIATEMAAVEAFRALAQSNDYSPAAVKAWTVLGTALGVVHSVDLPEPPNAPEQ